MCVCMRGVRRFVHVGDDVSVFGVCTWTLNIRVCICVYLCEAEKLRLPQVSVEI